MRVVIGLKKRKKWAVEKTKKKNDNRHKEISFSDFSTKRRSWSTVIFYYTCKKAMQEESSIRPLQTIILFFSFFFFCDQRESHDILSTHHWVFTLTPKIHLCKNSGTIRSTPRFHPFSKAHNQCSILQFDFCCCCSEAPFMVLGLFRFVVFKPPPPSTTVHHRDLCTSSALLHKVALETVSFVFLLIAHTEDIKPPQRRKKQTHS